MTKELIYDICVMHGIDIEEYILETFTELV
jgi:hypothetical protein